MTTRPLLALFVWLAGCALPFGALGALLARRRPRLPVSSLLMLLALGGAVGAAGMLAERGVLRLSSGVEAGGLGAMPLLVALGFVGPFEEGLKLAAVWPSFRARFLRGPLEGVTAAVAAATGFGLVEGAYASLTLGPSPRASEVAALALGSTMQALLASSWGYVLGHSYRRHSPRRGFFGAWAGAAAAHGVLEHLLSQRTTGGLLAALPLLAAMGLLAYMARGELRAGVAFRQRRPVRTVGSLSDFREALARRDRPIGLGRVVGGALVNQGVLVVMLALAVVLARRVGVDFAAVDDTEAQAVVPLFFLAGAAAVAFPASGFLLARGSDHPTLIEPALSAALAIVGLMVLLGVAAPLALAFALACTPIALVLAMAGAWVGIGR